MMQEQKARTLKTKQTEVSKDKKGVAAKGRTSVVSARAPKTRKSTLSDAVAKPSRTPAIKAKPKVKVVTPKVKKAEKPKLIRDSFKFPEAEYQAFDALKARCLQHGLAAKKSELVRAGLQALAALSDEALVAQVAGVEKLKTGRPSSEASA